jgi:hypothetical protein
MIHRYLLMPEPHNRNRNNDMVKAIGACRELVHPSH